MMDRRSRLGVHNAESRFWRALRGFLRTLAALFLLLTAAYLWLALKGFPDPLLRKLENRSDARGGTLRIGRLRLRRPGAIRLDQVEFRPDNPPAGSLFRFHRLDVQWNLENLIRGKILPREILLQDARFDAPRSPDATARNPAPLRADQFSGAIRFYPDGLSLDLSGRGLDTTRLRIVGSIHRDSPFRVGRQEPGEIAGTARDWTPILQTLHRFLAFDSNSRIPAIDLAFQARIEADGAPRISVRASGLDARVFGVALENWDLTLNWKDGRADPIRARVQSGGQTLEGSGWIDPKTRKGLFVCRGGLPGPALLGLADHRLPGREILLNNIALPRVIRIEAETGEFFWPEITHKITGRIHADSPGRFWGVPLSRFEANFRQADGWIFLDGLEANLGFKPGSNPVSGTLALRPATGEFQGAITAAADPTLLLPLLTPTEAFQVGSIVLLGDSPLLRGSFSGVLGDISRLKLDARVEGRDFFYNGAFIREAGFDLNVRDEAAQFSRLIIRRPEGDLRGEVRQDFARHRADFDIVSDISPYAIARILGPRSHLFVQQFRFGGPAHLVGAGWIGYRIPVSGEFQVRLTAEGVGMDWARTDHLEGDIRLLGRRLTLADLRGRAYGGVFAGESSFDLPESRNQSVRYEMSASVTGADLDAVMSALSQESDGRYEGHLNAELAMSGAAGTGEGPSVTGRGRLQVKKGHLMRISVFGGLSGYLSALIPGWGYTAQTDLRADFEIGQSRIRTENLMIAGRILSISARGSIGFDQSLSMTVQAQPMRKGPVADTLRFLAFPITKLLEFDLRGSLRNPEWSPRNLP
ncbi:MAG: AsmA-like C-terminal region-containing protein [Kiritimatiellia bacterium]|nr:AsmA-like C-terminal region-containing protein [Kiritimatiellia bacterium]